MASIKISELHPAGSELFQDSESFLNELTDDEMESVEGGLDLKKVLAKLSLPLSELAKLNFAQTIVSMRGNGVNNNTINGQSINARTAGNANTM
jgi:bacteriocin-like protein